MSVPSFPRLTFSIDGKPGADGASAPLIKTQWSINGVDNWHDNFFGADAYQRQSNDNGVTYGPAVRAVGEGGDDGVSPSQVFQRSATVPNAPANNSGNPPTGWFDGPPAGTDFIWQTSAKFRAGVQISSWTTPQRISGTDGFGVITSPPAFVIPSFSNGTTKPAWQGGSCRIALFKPSATSRRQRPSQPSAPPMPPSTGIGRPDGRHNRGTTMSNTSFAAQAVAA